MNLHNHDFSKSIDFKEILVCIVTPDPVSAEMSGTTHHERKTTVQLEAENNNIAHNETLIERDYFQDLSCVCKYVISCYKVLSNWRTDKDGNMGDTSHHFTHGIVSLLRRTLLILSLSTLDLYLFLDLVRASYILLQ